MMSSQTKQKTSLEWFFNAPSANFPQANGSPAFRELNYAYSSLADTFADLVTATARANPPVEAMVTPRRLAEVLSFKIKFSQSFSMVEAFELLSQLEYLAGNLQTWPNAADAGVGSILSLAKERFRRTLVSLISFAKESKDVSFKANVLELVKRFETIK